MTKQRTLSIIKPDITARNLTGNVIAMLENNGLRIIGQKRVLWTREQAENFYAIHRDRPFFDELVTYMTSGPIVLQVLEGDNAVAVNRRIMGATNPSEAEAGTIRAEFGEDIERNSVHGSDSQENAEAEIALCFTNAEIAG